MARGRKAAKRTKFKMSNGSGTVFELSGKRRKPWTAKVTKGWEITIDENGKPHKKQILMYLGFWKEEHEAIAALEDYLKNPYDENPNTITFKQLYDIMFERKRLTLSDSSIRRYNACIKHLAPFHDVPIVKIRTRHLQDYFDGLIKKEFKYSTLKPIKDICFMVFEVAMQNDLVNKNYASYVDIGVKEESKPKQIFTDEEIDLLFKNRNRYGVNIILILLYTGMRIQELLDVETKNVDIENWCMIGGNKTKAGRNRLVPIHSKIKDIVKEIYDHDIECGNKYFINNKNNAKMEYHNFSKRIFHPIMEELGMNHTIHETRHTFITKMDNADANVTSIKRIVGHSTGNDVTSNTYTHKDLEQLRKAIEKIK